MSRTTTSGRQRRTVRTASTPVPAERDVPALVAQRHRDAGRSATARRRRRARAPGSAAGPAAGPGPGPGAGSRVRSPRRHRPAPRCGRPRRSLCGTCERSAHSRAHRPAHRRPSGDRRDSVRRGVFRPRVLLEGAARDPARPPPTVAPCATRGPGRADRSGQAPLAQPRPRARPRRLRRRRLPRRRRPRDVDGVHGPDDDGGTRRRDRLGHRHRQPHERAHARRWRSGPPGP